MWMLLLAANLFSSMESAVDAFSFAIRPSRCSIMNCVESFSVKVRQFETFLCSKRTCDVAGFITNFKGSFLLLLSIRILHPREEGEE